MTATRRRANVVLLTLIMVGCSSGPPVGSVAPHFTAQDSTGADVDLASFEKTVLILDFWAVW